MFCGLLLILTSLLLTGCLGEVQLNQRAIVQAIGIDLGQDGGVELTFQIFAPAASGIEISASAENAKIITASGRTVSEAVQNATLTQGKELFIGHNRIVILSKELAEQGVEQTLSYFSANAFSRQNVCMMVSEGKAKELLSAKINQGILPAETLEKIALNTREAGMLQNIKLFEFLKALENKHESSMIPVAALQPDPEGQSENGSGEENAQSGKKGSEGGSSGNSIEQVSSISLVGMAIFSEGRMVGMLNPEESRGLMWIRDAVERTSLLVSDDKYEVASLDIFECDSKLIPVIEGKEIDFILELELQATIGEALLKEGQTVRMEDIDNLERVGEELIRKECLDAFQKAVREFQADVFNLGNLVWVKDVQIWTEIREDWPSMLKKIDLEVRPDLKIDRVGLEFKSDQTPR